MNILSPVALPAAPVTPASSILNVALQLLDHLERGQRIDAAILRAAMEEAFGASDTSGAWNWKAAYEACEVATVLFLRKYGKALFRKAASPASRLSALAKIAELLLIARTFLADTLAAQRDQLDAVGSLPPIGTSR